MHGNSQRKKVTQGGSQMSEAYIPFYFMPNKGKGMWAFWAGQSNCRKVRGERRKDKYSFLCYVVFI